jgi:methylenetetrahydrofolate reductase (NADPH)
MPLATAARNGVDIAAALQGYSIEVNPSEARIIDEAPSRLNTGTEVFLTWIPGTNPMDMVAPAAKLRRSGLIPVPHIGARHIESATQLEGLAKRLVFNAGVDRVLIVGGDREKSAGPYEATLQVMQSGIFQKAGITRIAVGGFPEGHPNITDAFLDEALAAKVSYAYSEGLQLFIVTQFCFEAEPIVKWLHRLRIAGIETPVRVGVAGPAGIVTLTRYAIRCGIGNSLRVLTEKPSFAKLLTEKGPEPILQGVVSAIASADRAQMPLKIEGFHFFVFGGFNKTVEWISARRGQSLQGLPSP